MVDRASCVAVGVLIVVAGDSTFALAWSWSWDCVSTFYMNSVSMAIIPKEPRVSSSSEGPIRY